VPRIVQGLPAGGKRLLPDSSGYHATIVAGVPTYLDGRETGALPGRLARGRRPGPLRQAA
jgi:N-acyl-D-amino-acid deacylase